jgi:hypothetical protein
LGGRSRCPTASPAMGFLHPWRGIKPPENRWKNVLLTYI